MTEICRLYVLSACCWETKSNSYVQFSAFHKVGSTNVNNSTFFLIMLTKIRVVPIVNCVFCLTTVTYRPIMMTILSCSVV